MIDLNVNGIEKWFGGLHVLKGVSFQVEQGDFYGTGRLPAKGLFLADYSWDVMPRGC